MSLEREYDQFNRGHTRAGQTMQTGGVYDTVAGWADWQAGSMDEAVGRATDSLFEGDIAGVGDHLAGSFDEATGRAVDSLFEGDIAGVGDHLAGSFDEAVGEATTGILELDVGKVGDALLGSYDEGYQEDVAGGGGDAGSGQDTQVIDRTDETTFGSGIESGEVNPWTGGSSDSTGSESTGSDSTGSDGSGRSGEDSEGEGMDFNLKYMGIGAAAIGGLYLALAGEDNTPAERASNSETKNKRGREGSRKGRNTRGGV